jgi:hypothetical protein
MEQVPLPGVWVQDDEPPRVVCDQMPANLRLTYDGEVLYIDGLRGGQYLTIEFADLLEALTGSMRGYGELP